jgi:hypothetical protein
MTMKRFAFAVAALLAATVVNAEIYQWKDENGKTIISDKPPAGNVQPKKIEAATQSTAEGSQKSLADRDMEFRKRQKESQESAEKLKKEQTASADKKENCDNARRYLQALESGERMSMRDDKGERYFMDDAQREKETTKARQAVQTSCQ